MALAIVLLSLVTLVSRIASLLHLTSTAVADITVIALVGSGYALLRYRGSLIPLSRPWHMAAVVVTIAATVAFIASQALVSAGTVPRSFQTVSALVLIVVWAGLVTEPIVRFWLVARGLPAVQAWRLRSLSLGFAGIVAILLIAVGAGTAASNQAVQLAIQLIVLAIVPLLYVSFAPPAWLRREWRASEEEGLRVFMQDLLLLREDRATLAGRALEWAMRLAGGASALALDGDGAVFAVRGLSPEEAKGVQAAIAPLSQGVHTVALDGAETSLLLLQIGGVKEAGR